MSTEIARLAVELGGVALLGWALHQIHALNVRLEGLVHDVRSLQAEVRLLRGFPYADGPIQTHR